MIAKRKKKSVKTKTFPLAFGFLNMFSKGLKMAGCFLLILGMILGQIIFVAGYEAHVINVTAKICRPSEIKSMGYWKNHPEIYSGLLPQNLGNEAVDSVVKAKKVFDDYNFSMSNKFKGQLLAMKFNIAYFGIGEYLVESESKTLNQLVAEADDLLIQNPSPPNSVLEDMKNLLDALNNLEHIRFCAAALPPEGCVLQLTKTASSDKVNRGDTIIYHLTFDNAGQKVCTGGGVKLKDTFGDHLQYLDYTSTRVPRSFSKSCTYLEWNFGSIYPDDPMIEIDLTMKVKDSAECDSTITNSANYWSYQTGWGDPAAADSQVICSSAHKTGIVINEFLPNPPGNDSAQMPDGEWVELYNLSDEVLDLAGYYLTDGEGDRIDVKNCRTNTKNTIIQGKGFLVVYRNGGNDCASHNFDLSNLNNQEEDTISLFDDANSRIDKYTYTLKGVCGLTPTLGNANINDSSGQCNKKVPKNKSYARIPDGSANWVDPLPTPGEPNSIDEGENLLFGPAVLEDGEDTEVLNTDEEIKIQKLEVIPSNDLVLPPSDVAAENTANSPDSASTPASADSAPEIENSNSNQSTGNAPQIAIPATGETLSLDAAGLPIGEAPSAVLEQIPIGDEAATAPSAAENSESQIILEGENLSSPETPAEIPASAETAENTDENETINNSVSAAPIPTPEEAISSL